MQNCLLKKINCIFILLIFSHVVTGKTIERKTWIKPISMPFEDFETSIKALGSDHISYAQYQLDLFRKQAQSFELKEKLISAQELYLSGEEKKAIKAFQEISQKALEADWEEEDRRIILYAFLRQAQIEKNSEKRKALLLLALEFYLFKINKNNYPDYHLFPPPLITEIQTIQKKINSLVIDWNKIFPKHEIILINGQKINKDKKMKIQQGFFRISAFSSSHQTWTKKQSLFKLLTETIKTTSLTKGWCQKATIKMENKKDHIQILPFFNCTPENPLNLKKTNSFNKKNLKIKSLNNKLLTQSSKTLNSHSKILNSLDLKKQNKNINLPTLLITGTSILALIFIFSLSHKNNKTPIKQSQEPKIEFIY